MESTGGVKRGVAAADTETVVFIRHEREGRQIPRTPPHLQCVRNAMCAECNVCGMECVRTAMLCHQGIIKESMRQGMPSKPTASITSAKHRSKQAGAKHRSKPADAKHHSKPADAPPTRLHPSPMRDHEAGSLGRPHEATLYRRTLRQATPQGRRKNGHL